MANAAGRLDGVKVVDLSLLLPGPLCAMYLGDMGADVLKIENPKAPDFLRAMGEKKGEGEHAESYMYLMVNRNKRAITLNLKEQSGREVFFKILEDADILLEGFRPGTMQRLGCGFEQLHERFPRLIFCALSGYGASGPYEQMAGHDGNYIAHAAALGITGHKDDAPVLPGFQLADIGGGTQIAMASILAALVARERTGRGQFLDVAMMDGTFSFLAPYLGQYQATKASPRRGEMMLSGALPNYAVYRCADGKYVMLGALEERFFRTFLRQVGHEDWLETFDPEAGAMETLRPKIAALFASKERDHWRELFLHSDCCLAPVNSIAEAFADPQLRERDMVVDLPHPQLGEVLVIGSPFKFSETPCSYRRHAPGYGEHTDEVLTELGYSAAEIASFREQKVV